MRLPQAWVHAAYRFIVDQIKCFVTFICVYDTRPQFLSVTLLLKARTGGRRDAEEEPRKAVSLPRQIFRRLWIVRCETSGAVQRNDSVAGVRFLGRPDADSDYFPMYLGLFYSFFYVQYFTLSPSAIPFCVPKGAGTKTVDGFLVRQAPWIQLIIRRVRSLLRVKQWPTKFPSFDTKAEVALLTKTIQTIQSASRYCYVRFAPS